MRPRIEQLERAIDNFPLISRGAGGTKAPRRLIVGKSNTIYALASPSVAIKGLRGGITITSVPLAAPADLTTTYPDGLCAAQDADTLALVWIATSVEPPGGATVTGAGVSVPSGGTPHSIWTERSFALPIDGGGGATATVHLVEYVRFT